MTETATQRLRAFIAVPLPKTLLQQIAGLQQRLCRAVPELKPANLENLHLTLHFLGEQTQDQLAKIAASMLSVGQKKKNFNATLTGLGIFPNQRQPKILWLGIQPHVELLDLYASLARALKLLGCEPDPRPYRPHLTIGRFKRPPRQAADLCPFLSYSCDSLTIDKMILFSSKLTASGAVHTPLQTVALLETAH